MCEQVVCVSKCVCVCEQIACEQVTCEQVLCEQVVCVSKLYVSKLCVSKRGGWRQEAGGSAQPKTRTPHKDVGNKERQ